jgi:hypothetical protein
MFDGRDKGRVHELERLAEVDPPLSGDAESCIGIKKLCGYYAGLLGRY